MKAIVVALAVVGGLAFARGPAAALLLGWYRREAAKLPIRQRTGDAITTYPLH